MTEATMTRLKSERMNLPRLQVEIARLQKALLQAQASDEPTLQRQCHRYQRRLTVYLDELKAGTATTIA